jgi:hypothetical protein
LLFALELDPPNIGAFLEQPGKFWVLEQVPEFFGCTVKGMTKVDLHESPQQAMRGFYQTRM